MTTWKVRSGERAVLRAVCLALIALVLRRLAVVVPAWIGGAPPAYPGEYAGRLYFALTEVPILGATPLALGTRRGPQAPWRRVLPWALLAVSVAAMVLDGWRG